MYVYVMFLYWWVVLTRGRLLLMKCIVDIAKVIDSIIGYGVDEFIYFDIIQPSQLAFLYKILPAKDFGGLFVCNCYHSWCVLTSRDRIISIIKLNWSHHYL